MKSNHHPIPVIENFHIVLWLLKDTCWLMGFKYGGLVLVIPTLWIAYLIAWRTRKDPMVFMPNLAVCCWITANSCWMLGEFFHYPFSIPALLIFIIGVGVMGYYFLRQFSKRSTDLDNKSQSE